MQYELFWYSWFQTFAVIWILYIFFWVFPRRQIVVSRRFGILYQFHLQRLGGWNWFRVPTFRNPVSVPSSKAGWMELIQGSETSANYNLTPGKYLEENIQYFGTVSKNEDFTVLITLQSLQFWFNDFHCISLSISDIYLNRCRIHQLSLI